jgi:DNA-binding NtrC family response regulator
MDQTGQFPDRHRQHVVLVVDDEPGIRAFLRDYLQDCGFFPLAVESGDHAAELLEAGAAVDLVFSDVRMPGRLDGFGLAQWVTEHRPEIPVLLATGDIGKENAAKKLCGAEIIAKPYDLSIAATKIRDVIDRRRMG